MYAGICCKTLDFAHARSDDAMMIRGYIGIGAVITLLTVCHLSHRESFLDVFVVAMIAPLISLVVIIALASLFGSF